MKKINREYKRDSIMEEYNNISNKEQQRIKSYSKCAIRAN